MLVDALHAVSALFHHTAAAHGHIRIAHHLVLRSFPVLEQQEIEAPHFVRAIVGTVARAHAAVVNHVIQAFAAVHGRTHRADHFAGSVLALLARHRLEVGFGIVAVALVVGVNAQPVHVPAEDGLFLADHGDVVLGLAGDDAIVAAHAGIHVHRHAPGVRLGRIGVGLVQSQFLRRLFFFREVRFLAVLLQTGSPHQRARAGGRLHGLIALGRGQLVRASNLANHNAAGKPGRGAGAQRVHIETGARADAAGAAASVAQKYGDGIIGMANLDPDRSGHLLAIEFKFDQVFGFNPHAVGHSRTHQHRVVPGELVHRLGQFLQPAVVGKLSVVDGGIAAEVDFDGLGVGARRGWKTRALVRDLLRQRMSCLPPSHRAATFSRTRRSPRRNAAVFQ